mgnify:CR=1 FL=1
MDNLIFTSESVILYERKRIHALKYEEIICITLIDLTLLLLL